MFLRIQRQKRRVLKVTPQVTAPGAESVVYDALLLAVGELSTSSRRRCDYVYKAGVQRTGVFHSPNYPKSYPHGVTCRYQFIGGPVDRVQLRFTQFNLRYHHHDADDPFQ